MTTISASAGTRIDPFERLIAGLEWEFQSADCDAVARRFLDAEAADFHWEARRDERTLGPYEGLEDDGEGPLARVAIVGCLAGKWFVATMIRADAGGVLELIRCEHFAGCEEAGRAFAEAG